MFFFLVDGREILARIRSFLPLDDTHAQRLLDRFVSVTRATLKGTILIGLAQGTLAGVGFAVAGIDGAVFWGTVMTFLSVLPGIGTAIIWLPASAVLLAGGRVWAAVLLGVWCGAIVGSIDNVMKPRLVGRDTKMHPLFIFLGTLGGISLFGVVGFLLGPIVAALFVTVWEIWGERATGDITP
jgi:predicted PurR-regulated permease PerM